MQHQTGANETILIVEDEPVIRLNIADYLRVQGFRVVEANSAVEAIEIMQSGVVQVDLVFSDVQMPVKWMVLECRIGCGSISPAFL